MSDIQNIEGGKVRLHIATSAGGHYGLKPEMAECVAAFRSRDPHPLSQNSNSTHYEFEATPIPVECRGVQGELPCFVTDDKVLVIMDGVPRSSWGIRLDFDPAIYGVVVWNSGFDGARISVVKRHQIEDYLAAFGMDYPDMPEHVQRVPKYERVS